MASGQKNDINITIGIIDFYGNIDKSSSSYSAALVGKEDTILKGTTTVYSVDGLFVFDDF